MSDSEIERAAPRAVPRDERIDFIRGWVMLILIIVHSEFFSLWNLIVFERVGVVSGAEGFVLLSGVVLGMVSHSRLQRDGWRAASGRLIDRGFQLYRVHVVLIVIVGVLGAISWIHPHEIITFTDRGSGTVYPLYPPPGTPIMAQLGTVATLRAGPHQIQVLGLYVVLLLAAPMMLAMLAAGRTRALLVISWILYLLNASSPRMPTGAQFEYAFPLLTWQVLFVHGLAVGFHWQAVQRWFHTAHGRIAVIAAIVIAVAFAVFTMGQTTPLLPAWARFELWSSFYDRVWRGWCQKNTLGPLRLLDYAALLIVIYAALTRWWGPFRRTLGWFLIPIGQATLYVFILHVFLIALVSAVVPFGFWPGRSVVLTTFVHTAELGVLWLMVKHQVMFRWIPR